MDHEHAWISIDYAARAIAAVWCPTCGKVRKLVPNDDALVVLEEQSYMARIGEAPDDR